MSTRRHLGLLAMLLATGSLLLAGCGSSDNVRVYGSVGYSSYGGYGGYYGGPAYGTSVTIGGRIR